MNSVVIKTLTESSDLQACVTLQTRVWGFSEQYAVPDHFLKVVPDIGGVLLGGYDGDALVGFLLAVPALKGGGVSHLMHMIGVDPDSRNHDVGLALLRQYTSELKTLASSLTPIHRVFWTYDPMESPSASLYFRKAGARAIAFLPDVYGEQPGQYQGLPTDRFEVLWEPFKERARVRLEGIIAPPTFADVVSVPRATIVEGGRGHERVVLQDYDPLSPRLLVEIPGDWRTLKKDECLPQARQAQSQLRMIFASLFDAHFVVTDLISEKIAELWHNAYLFERPG